VVDDAVSKQQAVPSCLGLATSGAKADHLAHFLENLKTSGVGSFVPAVLETMRFGGLRPHYFPRVGVFVKKIFDGPLQSNIVRQAATGPPAPKGLA
jgi:hypothetical protein